MGNNTPNAIPNVISNALDNVDPGRTLQYGPELVTNGDFVAWTADNPDGWSVVETPPNSEITEDANGARFISDGTAANIRQLSLLELGKEYRFIVDMFSVSSGSINLVAGTGGAGAIKNISSSGYYDFTLVADGTSVIAKRAVASTDAVMRSISVKEILNP